MRYLPLDAVDRAQMLTRVGAPDIDALFADMRPEAFDDARRAAFVERWGSEPEKIFGPLFVELRRLHNHVGG